MGFNGLDVLVGLAFPCIFSKKKLCRLIVEITSCRTVRFSLEPLSEEPLVVVVLLQA